MLRSRLSLPVTVLALLLVCPMGVEAGSRPGQSGGLLAYLDGRPIQLRSVVMYHCHDLEAPVIRCFGTAKERNADVLGPTGLASSDGLHMGTMAVQSVTYVLWYEHSAYGGGSFSASGPVPNLGALGWNNRISSFKSTNGGRPRWWDGTSYTGLDWQWAPSVWVSYVGNGANDRFTSVQNVP